MGESAQAALLLGEVAAARAEAASFRDERDVLRLRLEESRGLERVASSYAEASFWLFGARPADAEALYGRLCTAAVRVLGWDSAFTVGWPGGRIIAAAGATAKQRGGAEAVLSADSSLAARAASRALFSTFSGSEREGFVLRAAFHAEEAVAVPVSVARKRSVYLAVSMHERSLHRPSEEPYLAKLAATAGRFAEAIA